MTVEQKAEEYLKAQCEKRKEEFVIRMPEVYVADIPQAFIDGYHECQKEHEWHYVKDGDFPKDETEKEYLVALKSEYGGFFYEIDIWCKSLHCFASNNPTKVYAWKEIVLPELKESE